MGTPRSLVELKAEARDAYARFKAAPDRVAELDIAVDAVREAIPLAGSDDEQGALLTTLGVMLTDRYQVKGAPDDLEEGIWNYRRALTLTRDDSRRLPARLSNLGSGLFEHYIATAGSEVLREALDVATRALELTPADSPEWSVRVLNWSAIQLEALGASPDDHLLDTAIDVLGTATDTASPGGPAAQLNGNLATYLMKRYGVHGREGDLREAITAYRRALDLGIPALYVPRIRSNLGNALWEGFRQGRDTNLLAEAVDQHRTAVQLTARDQPSRIDYLTNLGTSLADLARETGRPEPLEEGLEAWEEAWRWIERFLGRSPVPHRLGLQDDLVRLSAQLVVALLDARGQASADRARALRLAEGSKARLITQLLGWVDLPAPPGVDEAVAARERKITRELVELDREELIDQEIWPPVPEAWNRASERASRRVRDLDELDALWSTIAGSGPKGAAFAQLRRGDNGRVPSPDAVTALLSILITPAETVFFLVRGGRDAPDVVRAPMGEEQWHTLGQRLYREIRTGRGADRGESWLEPLVAPFQELAGSLDGAERVVIAPHRRAHLVPWSVVARRAGWEIEPGTPLPVVVVPALSLLSRLLPPRGAAGRQAVVIGDPLGDLPHAAAEARAVAEELGVRKPLMGPQATVRRVTKALETGDVAHIAAHARFDGDSPLDSAIALADGRLTARQILAHRLHLDLLVLSACETAVGSPLAGDELMGVTQAFLCAGVRSMIVTLWPVNDLVTQAFMATFYRELAATGDRAGALARAGSSVACEHAWAHPYFWGAFELVGAWR